MAQKSALIAIAIHGASRGTHTCRTAGYFRSARDAIAFLSGEQTAIAKG
jgi:hypothetical protein